MSKEQEFADYLDEIYGDIDVCGLSYPASRVLADVDPIAYRTAFSDWENEQEDD